jgi:hypothetical protein
MDLLCLPTHVSQYPMPKLMTEKQLLANQVNGRKGGRKPGKIGKDVIAARRAIKMTLMERCQINELQHIDTLEDIAKNSPSDNARISAISLLLDRARGRVPHSLDATVSGNVTFNVITGVPEPDGPLLEYVTPEQVDQSPGKVASPAGGHVLCHEGTERSCSSPLDAYTPAVSNTAEPAPSQEYRLPKPLSWHRGEQ